MEEHKGGTEAGAGLRVVDGGEPRAADLLQLHRRARRVAVGPGEEESGDGAPVPAR